MAKMSYQEANYVRSSRLSNLIERNLSSGQGFLGSIGGAIGSKLKANVTGLKEKFDPLNLFKMLSGGNPLAFRLLGGRAFGRLTGRDEEDVDYFAGGPGSRKQFGRRKKKKTAEPLITKNSSGTKIKPISVGDGVADGISKLYTLLRQSLEDKNKSSEIKRNFEEGKKQKEEKRHKELIEALKGKSPKKEKVTKVDDGRKWYEGILESLRDGWDKVAKFAKVVAEFFGSIIKKVKDVAKSIWNKIKGIAADVFEKVMGVVRKLGSHLAELISKIPGASWIGEKIVQGFNAVTEGASKLFSSGAKAAEKAETKAVEKVAEKTVGKSLLKKIPILGIGAGLFFGAQRALAGDWLGAGLEVTSGVLGSIPGAGTAASVAIDAGLAVRDVVGDKNELSTEKSTTNSSGIPSASPVSSTGNKTSAMSESSVTTSPVSSVNPSGSKMVSATEENMEAQMEETSGGGSIITNKTNASSIGGKTETGYIGETAVRNDEDSFLRTIKQSLRMV